MTSIDILISLHLHLLWMKREKRMPKIKININQSESLSFVGNQKTEFYKFQQRFIHSNDLQFIECNEHLIECNSGIIVVFFFFAGGVFIYYLMLLPKTTKKFQSFLSYNVVFYLFHVTSFYYLKEGLI